MQGNGIGRKKERSDYVCDHYTVQTRRTLENKHSQPNSAPLSLHTHVTHTHTHTRTHLLLSIRLDGHGAPLSSCGRARRRAGLVGQGHIHGVRRLRNLHCHCC